MVEMDVTYASYRTASESEKSEAGEKMLEAIMEKVSDANEADDLGREKQEPGFSKADTSFAFAALVIGFLYWNLIDLSAPGMGITIFATLLFAVSFMYLRYSGIRQNADSLICLALAGLSASVFTIFDNHFIRGLNFIFISVMFLYWVCVSAGRRIKDGLSAYIIGDAIQQGISAPFSNFGRCPSALARFMKGRKTMRALPAIIGILVFLPVIALVTSLLMSADMAFENFINFLFGYINFRMVTDHIWQFILGVPVAFYIYGSVYGNAKGRRADNITAGSVDKAAMIMKIAPKATIYSALVIFNGIYCAFFTVQAVYLFSAFYGNLPEAFTYAQYARRGFFELCAVAGINLAVLAVSHLTLRKGHNEEPKAMRILTALISAFTMALIVTAQSKMIMYISAYGLTQLRVYTSWFMALLFIVFIGVFVRQFVSFNLEKYIIISFVCMFMILSYGNADGLIAGYNIRAYEAGALSDFDIDMIADLSDAAVPYIYDMYLRTDANDARTRQRLADAIQSRAIYGMYGQESRKNFRAFNLQRYRADKIRASLVVGNR